jgi:hypothetical protein
MNPDIKAEWIASLTDGSYKQGKFQLRDLDDHFDAIGVLMDRAANAGVIDQPIFYGPDREGAVFYGWRYDGSATRITRTVEEWSGLAYWAANRILTMNDSGKSFDEIASYIKDYL